MLAIALEAPPAAGSALASLLRRQVAALRPACQEIEQACLQGGERIAQTIPATGELAEVFKALSAELAGPAFAASAEDLGRLTDELGRAADELAEENRTLDRLAELNGDIGRRIGDLLGFTRTMSWLVFTLKIESAPLTRLSADMTAFAEDIHKLAETTRGALEDYHATHFRLQTLLAAARAAQARFQEEHQARLAAVALELRRNLDHASERRRVAIAGLRETGVQAQGLVERVGESVVALQIGDRTRQCVEHAHHALALAADALDGRAAAALSDLPAADIEILAARACLLQARQIQAARTEYAAEAGSVTAALEALVVESDELAARGRDLFGRGETPEGSFLAAIEARLVRARDAVAHFGGARAAVDEAARSVAAIVEDMRQRTAALTDHVIDITIIGTNALLRSTRLGEQGKGVALIARELRAYGEQTGAIIRQLPEALDGLVELAARLSRGGRLDATAIAGLEARMEAAIGAFGASHREIESALARLALCAQDSRERLVEAAAGLGASARTGETLRAAEAELEAAGGGYADARRPDLDRALDAMLLPGYTMDSEREIHAGFTGAGRPRASGPKRKPRYDAASVEAMLL